MRLIFSLFIVLAWTITVPAQTPSSIFSDFMEKEELKHATVGFSLLDETGETVMAHNDQSSLSPASTQKLLTSITALEVLGYDHKFVTTVSIAGSVVDSVLLGNVLITSGGDPTLGSEDFKNHYGNFIESWISAIKQEGIKEIDGRVLVDDRIFSGARNAGSSAINDVGNYYGAGAPSFPFMDNEFSVYFNTTSVGNLSDVVSVQPELPENIEIVNEVKAGSVNGDNVIIYSLEGSKKIVLSGTLPPNRSKFRVRGSIPNVKEFAEQYILAEIVNSGLPVSGSVQKGPLFMNTKEIIRTKSPALIEILKVLNKKSVNTYADILLKHIDVNDGGKGSLNGGSSVVMKYWKNQGLDTDGINMEDGSGLSRKNNVTASFMTDVLASVSKDEQMIKVMNEATRSQSVKSMWGGEPGGLIQAKSGYIGRVRAYSGYLLKNNKRYPFHFMVNNYHGSSSQIRKLMGEVLRSTHALL